ncbi:hypothetical protein BJ170DRAFT_689252 [Xylariales sp. AK1849]|nr:hypothetical protein BJ170DRAFT_689252 [Xylariales sp. AK1849]
MSVNVSVEVWYQVPSRRFLQLTLPPNQGSLFYVDFQAHGIYQLSHSHRQSPTSETSRDSQPRTMRPQEAASIATTTLATAIVAIRIFTQIRIARENLGLGEYLTIAAVTSAWLFAGFVFTYDAWVDKLLVAAATEGAEAVEAVQRGGFDRYNAVTGIFFVIALCLGRLSILVFYLRLSPIRSFRYAVYGVIVFICLQTIACVVLSLLLFSPLVGSQIRNADHVLGLFYGISNILVDLCMLLLPIRVVVPLQMSTKRKVAVLMLFAAGTFVCAAAIWRAMSITFITKQPPTADAVGKELTISFAEANGAIICACVPVITRFFTQFLPDVVTSYIRSSKGLATASTSPHSTTIEKNRRRREQKVVGREPRSETGSSMHKVSQDGIMPRSRDGDSFTTLERNVLGKGRADILISADREVFAPDEKSGITCIHDTRVSYGP